MNSPAKREPLSQELAIFNKHRSKWLLSHEGEWAVIYKDKLLGFEQDWDNGVRRAILVVPQGDPVLVKQVLEVDHVYVI